VRGQARVDGEEAVVVELALDVDDDGPALEIDLEGRGNGPSSRATLPASAR